MTSALLRVDDTEVAVADEIRYASWGTRAGAFALDVLPGTAVVVTMALLVLATPNGGWLWWVYTATAVIAALATLANRCLLPPTRGWSVGRAVVGIRVVRADGESPGAAHPGGCANSLTCWIRLPYSSAGCGRCGTSVAARSQTCCCAPKFA